MMEKEKKLIIEGIQIPIEASIDKEHSVREGKQELYDKGYLVKNNKKELD